jgi:hypothetical protein
MTDNDPYRYRQRPPKLSGPRTMMYLAAFLHVVAVVSGLLLLVSEKEVTISIVALVILGVVAIPWYFVARNHDSEERSSHLFPAPDKGAPKVFTDFKDDTGSNL